MVTQSGQTRTARSGTVAGVKVREVLELIHEDGWVLVAVRGSHRQFEHPTKRGRVTVPGKPSDDLHPKIAASILHQAGLR